MTQPTFGISFNLDSNEPRPTVGSDMSTVGLVLPSADADAATFPLNQPVEFNSNDAYFLSRLGTGPMFRSVTAINDQLAKFQVAARIIAVRVAQGETIEETIENIVGSQAAGTGIYALLRSGPEKGVIPRIVGAPGFTGHFTRTDPSIAVARTQKFGGNTGNGLMTLAGTPNLAGVQNGVYVVRATGGTLAVTSAAAGGNIGNGTVSAVTVDAGSSKGAWVATCLEVATNGGTFVVTKPNGAVFGLATVGTAFSAGTGINFTIGDGAVDFALGDKFTFTVADAIPADGGAFSVIDPQGINIGTATVGTPFATQIAFTIGDGSTDYAIGDGFDVTVAITGGVAEANLICAELPAVCNAMLAHAVVGGPGTTKQAAIDWRETLNSPTLIPVDNYVKTREAGVDVYTDMADRVIGQGVATDFQHQGVPSHSWANQPIQGILGLKRYDSFSLTDGATDGQILLSHNIGIISRGELGVETAIAQSGFNFIGTDNAGDDPLWQFYNGTRVRDSSTSAR